MSGLLFMLGRTLQLLGIIPSHEHTLVILSGTKNLFPLEGDTRRRSKNNSAAPFPEKEGAEILRLRLRVTGAAK